MDHTRKSKSGSGRLPVVASAFPADVRARAVGLYWGIRSFAFFPAPIVAYLLWRSIGPDYTFLIGGTVGMIGTLYFGFGFNVYRQLERAGDEF